MWVWSDVCLYVGANTFVCTCGRQRSVPGIFLCYSLTYSMREALSLSLELIYSARPVGQQALEIHLSPLPQHWDSKHAPLFLGLTLILET